VIVVHALWREGGLTLWGEDATSSDRPASSDRPDKPHPRGEHPFAAAVEDLAAAVGGPAREGLAALSTLHLPTRGRVPMDSPELVREEEPRPDRGAVTLAEWRVPTLSLGPDEALEVLARLSAVRTRASTR